VLGALASALIIPAARPAAADSGPTVTSASAQDDGNGQFSVSFSWSSPGDPVVQYIVSNSSGMCTQAQNISSESGSVQDQPCEDPFNYGDTLWVYISTASDNCNGWQDPSGNDSGYPLTLPSAPATTTTTEPYSPPVTEEPAPTTTTTTTTEPAPVPTTPSVITPPSSDCSKNDPFIADYQALQAEVQGATAQLGVLEKQLDQVRGDVTLSASTRESEANQLAEFAIPEQKRKIANLESGLERMAPTVEQIKADCAGQSAQGQGPDLPQQANLGNGQVLAQPGAKGFAELPWFVDVQSGALYWTEHHLTTFSCRFGSVPDPSKAPFILQRCRYVVTPQAVAVLLGTEFAVDVSRGATAFRVFSGEVDVSDLAGTKTVQLAAGQMTTVATGGVPSEPVSFASSSVRHWWARSAFVGSWLFYLLIGLCVVAALAVVGRRQLRAAFAVLGSPTVQWQSGEPPRATGTSVTSRSGEPYPDWSLSSSRIDVPEDAVQTAADDPVLAVYARHLRALVIGGLASLTVGIGLMATAVSRHRAPGVAEGLWVVAWILFLPGPVCAVALLARFLQVRPRIRALTTETALRVQGSQAQVVALCQKALAMERFKGISVDSDGTIVAWLRTTGQRRRSQIEVRMKPTESGVLVHARCEARPESAASLFRHPSQLVVAKFASGLSALTDVRREQQGAQGEPPPFDASSQRASEPWSAHSLPEDRGVNGLAVAALVLGILWIFWIGSILAAIFGHVGLGQIRRRGQSGRGMALAGVVLGWAGIALLVSVVVLATVTGFNAEDRKPPAQILRDAVAASENASSVHLSGWSGSSSSLVDADLVLSKGASGGSLTESEGAIGLVVANGYVYLKADASFWQQATGDSSAAQALGGRWIKGSETNSDFSGFSKLTHVFGQIKVQGKLYKEPDVTLDGMSVIPLTDSRGTTIYVADTGSPHIVRIVHSALSPEGPGEVALNEYGTAPVPSVPTGAIDMASDLSG
jgi:hypothetical protein